jgi:hypothetical protein
VKRFADWVVALATLTRVPALVLIFEPCFLGKGRPTRRR